MKREHRYGIAALRKDFPTDKACLEFVFNALHTKECGCGGVYALRESRKQYQCSRCRSCISPTVGTIFERSVVSLPQWFNATLLVHKGIGIKALQRELGTTYKTAWRCSHILRNAMRGDTIDLLCQTKDGVNTTRKTKKQSLLVQKRGERRTQNVPANIKKTDTHERGLKFFLGTQKEYQNVLAVEKPNYNFLRLTT
jgi:transposase-like protein